MLPRTTIQARSSRGGSGVTVGVVGARALLRAYTQPTSRRFRRATNYATWGSYVRQSDLHHPGAGLASGRIAQTKEVASRAEQPGGTRKPDWRLLRIIDFAANWVAAVNGACVLASIALVIAAYTSLPAASDICVASRFVADTVKLAQSAARVFAGAGSLSVAAAIIGRYFRGILSTERQCALIAAIQLILLFCAMLLMFTPEGIHVAFDRQWFSTEKIQERWQDFRKACPTPTNFGTATHD
jgi:hypothetical protein